MALELGGGCLCGAVRFECRQAPVTAVFCHCRDCQRAHSAPYAACALMPPGSVVLLTGEPKRCETPAQSGAAIIREFCERCGTQLFSSSAAYPAFRTVKIGALDEPGAISPVAHVWTDRLIDWAGMDDGLPRFAGNADMAELERLWRESRGT